MSDMKKITRSALRAGFNAGWAAAMQTVAEQYAKAGEKETAATMRRWAGMPPQVELVDLATPEGQAMKRESETVWMEDTRGAPKTGGQL
jgi:hypothetical protein